MRTATQVIVAGGGPVGLMLAAELRLGGAEVTVLEAEPEPAGQSRAPGVYARTVEVWRQRGILDRFPEHRFGRISHFALLPVGLDLGVFGSPEAVMLLPQALVEKTLSGWAEELGARVLRGHTVEDLEQDSGGVTVTVRDASGETRRLRAGYVVGCDGGRSTVRRLAGFDFPGTSSTTEILLADVAGLPADLPALRGRPFPYVRGEHGWLAMSVVTLSEDRPDLVRIIAGEFGRAPARRPAAPAFDEVRRVVHAIAGIDLSGTTPAWLSSFGNGTRQVTRYRRGRVLLAGDAAHVHPPFGGQGLNMGIQDAVNLGWKLAAEVTGRAPAGLLDSYHDERHPVAARVLLNTRAQDALMRGGPETESLRTVVAELLAVPEANRRMSAEISALGVRYDLGDGPLVGRRVPPAAVVLADGSTRDTLGLLRGAKGVLLNLAGEPAYGKLAARWGERVDVVEAGAPEGELASFSALLVRPDGHVAWSAGRGEPADEAGLEVALSRWFGSHGE
ncbi:FAD-dependent monooxygenase [Amycolatopsis sp., V23-08]|uniref:FAD-dependent monooxygenase n=1 Tax=Amycolatopsis heterodermiae TaxID=3110235 RepID=A0ABU5R3T3_9PSEU|nr:FAD-dependent monooxygenase [Amycolatopsis sp., V23-08]MEA5360354.1 FAD-dependent monooxygenase [Amycolatopsis sp., V23-08]